MPLQNDRLSLVIVNNQKSLESTLGVNNTNAMHHLLVNPFRFMFAKEKMTLVIHYPTSNFFVNENFKLIGKLKLMNSLSSIKRVFD